MVRGRAPARHAAAMQAGRGPRSGSVHRAKRSRNWDLEPAGSRPSDRNRPKRARPNVVSGTSSRPGGRPVERALRIALSASRRGCARLARARVVAVRVVAARRAAGALAALDAADSRGRSPRSEPDATSPRAPFTRKDEIEGAAFGALLAVGERARLKGHLRLRSDRCTPRSRALDRGSRRLRNARRRSAPLKPHRQRSSGSRRSTRCSASTRA